MYPDHVFCPDWQRVGVAPLAQTNYVTSELIRLGKLGVPLITAAKLAPLEIQSQLAHGALSGFQLGEHELVWRLALVPARLREGSVRHRDCDGKLLPPDLRGKVLRAKVGTKGGQVLNAWQQPREVLDQYTGAACERTQRTGSIHLSVDVLETPRALPYRQAETILQRFGYSIPRVRHPRSGEVQPVAGIPDQWRLDRAEPALRHERMRADEAPCRIDDWIVLELPQPWAEVPSWYDALVAPPSKPAKGA